MADTTTADGRSQVMQSKTAKSSGFPVEMYWQIGEDGGMQPTLNVEAEGPREQIFDAFGVESLSELEDALVKPHKRGGTFRLGLLITTADDDTFCSEQELLETVEGVTEELAEAFVDQWGDIPSLCEERRRDGEVLLGDTLSDARVLDEEWAVDLEEFVTDLSHDDNLEHRLKAAGIWVEPDHVTA